MFRHFMMVGLFFIMQFGFLHNVKGNQIFDSVVPGLAKSQEGEKPSFYSIEGFTVRIGQDFNISRIEGQGLELFRFAEYCGPGKCNGPIQPVFPITLNFYETRFYEGHFFPTLSGRLFVDIFGENLIRYTAVKGGIDDEKVRGSFLSAEELTLIEKPTSKDYVLEISSNETTLIGGYMLEVSYKGEHWTSPSLGVGVGGRWHKSDIDLKLGECEHDVKTSLRDVDECRLYEIDKSTIDVIRPIVALSASLVEYRSFNPKKNVSKKNLRWGVKLLDTTLLLGEEDEIDFEDHPSLKKRMEFLSVNYIAVKIYF